MFNYGNYSRMYDNVRPRMQMGQPMMTANQGMSPTGQIAGSMGGGMAGTMGGSMGARDSQGVPMSMYNSSPTPPPMMSGPSSAQLGSAPRTMSTPLTASPMQGQPGIPPTQPNYGAIARQMTPAMQTAQPNVQLPRGIMRGMAS